MVGLHVPFPARGGFLGLGEVIQISLSLVGFFCFEMQSLCEYGVVMCCRSICVAPMSHVLDLQLFGFLIFWTSEASLLGLGRQHRVHLSRRKNEPHECGPWAKRMHLCFRLNFRVIRIGRRFIFVSWRDFGKRAMWQGSTDEVVFDTRVTLEGEFSSESGKGAL